MTLSGQLEGQRRSMKNPKRSSKSAKNQKTEEDKKGVKSKQDDKNRKKSDTAVPSKTEVVRRKRKSEEPKAKEEVDGTEGQPEKGSLMKRTLSSLLRSSHLRRSFSFGKDLNKTSMKRNSWTSSLVSLREEVEEPIKTRSLLVPSPEVDKALSAGTRRRAASHSALSYCSSLDYTDAPYGSCPRSLVCSQLSLPGSLPEEENEELPTPVYRRQNSDSTATKQRPGGSCTKLKRQQAFKNGRSRSLNHIDQAALDATAPAITAPLPPQRLHGGIMGALSLETPANDDSMEHQHQCLAVPDNDASAAQGAPFNTNRRHKLVRSQMNSSEYFSVSFEIPGDDSGPDEFVAATKGVLLSDALSGPCTRRGVDVSCVAVFLDSTRTPLNIDTACIGGKHVRVRVRDDRSPIRSSSKSMSTQPPLRKSASGSYQRGGKGSAKFFSASTEDQSFLESSLDSKGSVKSQSSASSRQRWSGLFGNSKDTKMGALVEQLNSYTKNGIPRPVPGDHDDFARDMLDCCPPEELQQVEEQDWRALVTQPLSERQSQQQTAIWELFQTEAAYIRTLRVVTDLFLACLRSLQTSNILNEIDTTRLFCNIEDICMANIQLWTEHLRPILTDSRATGRPLNPQCLQAGFLKFQEIFRPYTKYCAEQLNCQLYCREKHQENELFTAYLAWCETRRECNRLRLVDILVKPMQRLTKYSLLLKAVLKNTDSEDQCTSLARMVKSVDEFVNSVNTTLKTKQDDEKLRGVNSRIDSYDVVESGKDDELERLVRTHSYLDLTARMPGCHPSQKRELLLEADLKLRDGTASKVDVHCLLLTDILLLCKPTGGKRSAATGSLRIIRQPFLVERLKFSELNSGLGLALVYVSEWRTAVAAFTLSSSDTKIVKSWADGIKRAQDLYATAKRCSVPLLSPLTTRQPNFMGSVLTPTQQIYDQIDSGSGQLEVEWGIGAVGGGTANSRSPRMGSSRGSRVSSLAHSHSGSMDMNEVSSISSVSQSRGISVENDMNRGSSLSSDEGIPPLAGDRQPSPRADRRSLLLLSPSPSPMSVLQVPAFSGLGQSLPNLTIGGSSSPTPTPPPPTTTPPSSLLVVPPHRTNSTNTCSHSQHLLSPGHRGISYPPPSPPRGSLRRTMPVPQSRNPPLVKTRHITSPGSLQSVIGGTNAFTSTSDFDVPLIGGVSPPSDDRDNCDTNAPQQQNSLAKRLTRTDNRRYHTAGAIDDIKKQDTRDSSIHKRLSWNCGGAASGAVHHQQNQHTNKSISSESMRSSSGVSSTGSLARLSALDLDLADVASDPIPIESSQGLGLLCECRNEGISSPPISSIPQHIFTAYIPGPECDSVAATNPTQILMQQTAEAVNIELIQSLLNPHPEESSNTISPQPVTPELQQRRVTGGLQRMKDAVLSDSSSLETSNV